MEEENMYGQITRDRNNMTDTEEVWLQMRMYDLEIKTKALISAAKEQALITMRGAESTILRTATNA